MDKFIEKYVLCSKCGLPEIDMAVSKRGSLVATCAACGWKGGLDNTHRLAAFILKNPPDADAGLEEERTKKSRSQKQAERIERLRNSGPGDEDGDDNADD